MIIYTKHGVKVSGLKMAMQKPLEIYTHLCVSHGIKAVITEAVAKRQNKSLHTQGYAVDVRLRDFKKPIEAFKCLRLSLEPDYDVIYYPETKHAHIEYQRYLDMSKPYFFYHERATDES